MNATKINNLGTLATELTFAQKQSENHKELSQAKLYWKWCHTSQRKVVFADSKRLGMSFFMADTMPAARRLQAILANG